jgi:hypothetical protein
VTYRERAQQEIERAEEESKGDGLGDGWAFRAGFLNTAIRLLAGEADDEIAALRAELAALKGGAA